MEADRQCWQTIYIGDLALACSGRRSLTLSKRVVEATEAEIDVENRPPKKVGNFCHLIPLGRARSFSESAGRMCGFESRPHVRFPPFLDGWLVAWELGFASWMLYARGPMVGWGGVR